MAPDFSSVRVTVVGSVNLDIVARVDRFPEPGETLTNAVVSHFPGGKGGNQALAARRLGASVNLVACTGEDGAADQALANLAAEGVGLDRCRRLPGINTGLALILVAASGENQIVVAPGANAAFAPADLDIPDCDAVIAQLEVPMDTILAAATGHPGLFCLNAAPARRVPAEVLEHVDLLVVNQIESRAIGDCLENYRGLLATTFGADGAELRQGSRILARSRPPEIAAVDTVGAGDAFTATLVVALAAGTDQQQALDLACRAGALTTTREGAQSSPSAAELAL